MQICCTGKNGPGKASAWLDGNAAKLLFHLHSAGTFKDSHKGIEMKHIRNIACMLAVSSLALALSACEKPEGPAERAGKQVDNTLERTGQQLNKAGQNIENAAKDLKK